MMRNAQSPRDIFDPAEIRCEEISNTKTLVKEPAVSVQMITYNHAPYIGQAIEGVLQQKTVYPFELVIGEDCSTDSTRKIALDYQKKHARIIRVITSGLNVGAKRNEWRVHRASRGRYVAFCEGDDYWHHPYKLQRQIDYLEAHPDIGLVHSAVNTVIAGNGKTGSIRRSGRGSKEPKDTFLQMMLGKYQLSTPSVCVRNALLDTVMRSDPEVYCSDHYRLGDLPLWLDLANRTAFHYFDEPLATYRILEESATHSRNPERVKQYKLSALELRLRYLDKYVHNSSDRARILRYLRKNLLRSGFALNDWEMVERGKQLCGGTGIEGFLYYHAVRQKYLRTVLLPLQCLANRRWAWGSGFIRP